MRSFAELVDRRGAIIANLRREVGEVRNAAAAVGQRAVNLKAQIRRRRLAIIEVRDREHDVPEREAVPFAGGAHRFEILPVALAERAVVHQRVMVVAQLGGLARGDEFLEMLIVARGAELLRVGVVWIQIDVRPFAGREFADQGADFGESGKKLRARLIAQIESIHRWMFADFSDEARHVFARGRFIDVSPVVVRHARIGDDGLQPGRVAQIVW